MAPKVGCRWLEQVIGVSQGVPEDPAPGDRYIVGEEWSETWTTEDANDWLAKYATTNPEWVEEVACVQRYRKEMDLMEKALRLSQDSIVREKYAKAVKTYDERKASYADVKCFMVAPLTNDIAEWKDPVDQWVFTTPDESDCMMNLSTNSGIVFTDGAWATFAQGFD